MISTSEPTLKRTFSIKSNTSDVSKISAFSAPLLFGEISPSSATSPTSSVCNLVLSTSPAFLRFWMNENCRDTFLAQVEREDLSNIRMVCHDLAERAAPFLFQDVRISFKASTFTRPARMAALERIGHHVQEVTFNMPHSMEMFLPPLIDPWTAEERIFVYNPQIQTPATLAGRVRQPKYGSWEMTELLIKQYPPVFHAATNVGAFVRAFDALNNIRKIDIRCLGQEPTHRYRRSVIDYALISLRIAIERAALPDLSTLALQIHPGALRYLSPLLGYGSTPSSAKRWLQIRNLSIEMDSFPFDGPGDRTDHLKFLHAYLRNFTSSLERFVFRWHGERGPCPLTLEREPCLRLFPSPPSPKPHPDDVFAPYSFQPHPAHQISSSVASPTSDRICAIQAPSRLRHLRFPRLVFMELENATTTSSQVSTFIMRHRRTLLEFNFENTILRAGSTWEEALAPLTKISGNEDWKRKVEEVWDVPCMLSPVGPPRPQLGRSDTEESFETCRTSLSAMLEDEENNLETRLSNIDSAVKGRSGDSAAARAATLDVKDMIIEGFSTIPVSPPLVNKLFGPRRSNSSKRSKEHGAGDHLRRFLKNSVFTWR